MGDASSDESAVETSFSDIDSVLATHLGSNFCYKRREANGTITHVLKKMKGDDWADQITIEDEKVKGFDNEEIATFIIQNVMRNRGNERAGGIFLLLIFIVWFPISLYIDLSLGITDPWSIPSVLIGGATMLPFFILCWILSDYEENLADNKIYSTRSNFIEVLRKMKELEESEAQKAIIESRIRRLLDRYQAQPIE